MGKRDEGSTAEARFVRDFLRRSLERQENGQSVRQSLAELGGFYGAESVCVYALEAERLSPVCYWRDENARAGAEPWAARISGAEKWLSLLDEAGGVSLSGLDACTGEDAANLRSLCDAERVMACTVMAGGAPAGLLCVCNPCLHMGALLPLGAASAVCRETPARSLDEEGMTSRARVIQALGEIYTSMYYIDLATGHFVELSSVASVHQHIGARGDARDRLTYFCHHMVAPECREEMLEFVDLSTLDQRLKHTRIITRQYLSTLFSAPETENGTTWRQCCFIEGDRDASGRLAHVIFTTQSIHDVKVRELEARRRLQETNENLEALLSAEKQNSAIISALSNVYFALYYLDLDNDVCQTIISDESHGHVLGAGGSARAALERMVRELVEPGFQVRMRSFADYDTLGERLGNKSIIIQEYPDQSGGWTRCGFIPVERENTGRTRTVLVALRDITAEREERATRDSVIQALAISYENVYAVSADTDEAVCYRMGQAMSDRYGRRFAVGSYERNIRTYIENDVLEADRALFDPLRTVADVNALLADRQAFYFNYRVSWGGQEQYFQCQLVQPNLHRGGFVIAFKNVDEEKKQELAQQQRVEEALEKVERINAALQEETAVSSALSREYHSLFKIDAETGGISLYWTDGIGMERTMLERLVACGSYETVLNQYIDAFVAPEDQERIRRMGNLQVLLEQVPEVGLYKLGYRRCMNGVTAYYEMNTVRTADANGHVTLVLGMRDMDKEMRRQLKQTQEMEVQREIIEGLGSEYYSVLLVNPRTDTVATFRAEDEDGLAVRDYFIRHGNRWSTGLQSYAEELVSEGSRKDFLEKLSLEYIRTVRSDYSLIYEKLTAGGAVYLQARIAYVRDRQGEPMVVVGTRNVDDLIKKERQTEMALMEACSAAEAASRAKSDFLSNMSHDIRTPMNGIIGMTAIATAHLDDRERVQDSLQKITQASKHLLSLINEVLDMSKIESGKVSLVEEEFNLSDLIDNLLDMTKSQLEKHRHTFSVNITGVTHETVLGDSLRIQKVFTNLMSNAMKYTPEGGKTRLSITERPTNQPKVGCYEFVFEDNGIGMSEDFIQHIFEPFARARDAQVEKIQGTGLGMSISRNIVRMMGGDIKVESRLGVGSRFTVTIYLKLREAADIHYDKFVDLDVLVVDDDELGMESCCDMLNDMGMKAEGVTSGAEAVERVARHHLDKRDYFACIIDWKMPGMDGIATTRAIRQVVGNDVPIIIISAYDWAEIEQEARGAGANAFISKPLFRSRLERTFDALTGGDGTDDPWGNDRREDQHGVLDALESLHMAGRRALLVEDNDLNAEIAAEWLKMAGLEVERACDGIEAVDRMTLCPDGYYDIVFMDIQMPRMNGYDATRVIRAMDRSYCRQVPIVAMTANAFAEDVQAARTVGMNEHLAKPLDLTTLARTLGKWFR